jgi:hypothetical protein
MARQAKAVLRAETLKVVADRGYFSSQEHPHDLAAVIAMLENLLADELTLTIAIGGEPDPLGGAQCLANGSVQSGGGY